MPSSTNTTTANRANGSRGFAILWVVTLWLVFAGTWFGWGQVTSSEENRELAPKSLSPTGFAAFLSDHFGFRGWLIAANAWAKRHLLHSASSSDVILGSNGYLFYGGDRSLENYMGLTPMTDCELGFWVETMERRVKWLRERNIASILILTPDKQTVYPDLMPRSIPHPDRETRASRLLAALQSKSTLPLVDARSVLRRQRSAQQRPLFSRIDSHWNGWGAYYAYQALLQQLQASEPALAARMGSPLPESRISERQVTDAGDLTRLLGLGPLDKENNTEHRVIGGPPVSGGLNDPLIVSGTGDKSQPRAVLFRDSFGVGLMPLLGTHFERLSAVKKWEFDPALIAQEKPDLVIFEIVERRLNDPVPVDPLEAMGLVPPQPPPHVWGIIDSPQDGAVWTGRGQTIYGWALALQPASVAGIEVLIDGSPLAGTLRMHLPREGVALLQPGQKDSYAAGAEMRVDSRTLSNGEHKVTWVVSDTAGHRVAIGSRRFCVVN